MRKIFSAIAVIVGLVALLLGVGQRTIWAPPETLTATLAPAPKGSPLTVIESGVVSASDTPVQLKIESKGEFTASLARADDVKAWVGESAHTTITGVDTTNLVLNAEATSGKATSPNPAGADLFYGTETATDSMTYRWSAPDDGNWSLLLAADGRADAPTNITVSWAGNTDTPFSMPLIVVGSLLILIGLAGLLTRRRNSGTGGRIATDSPRRSSPTHGTGTGAGTAKRLAAGATALSLLVLPAAPALAADATPSAVESDTASTYPVLLPEQLQRILDSVSTTVTSADKKRDAKALAKRVDGGALRLRTANYSLLTDGVKVRKATPFSVNVIRSAAVTTSTGFPRNIMVVTAADNKPATVPTVLALTQATPWAPYKLVSAPPMLAGATFPGIGIGDVSVQSLKPGDKTLKTTPEVALTQLAKVLDDDKAKEKANFADNPYVKINATEQAALVKANKANATVAFARKVSAADTLVLSAPDGGAIVMGQLTSTTTVTPKEAGGKVVLDDITAKITGVKDTDKGIEVSYGESMLMYIPATGSSDKIRLVAAESTTLGAKLKK